MSRRSHSLSKEELEVHEACFGSVSDGGRSIHSEPATPNPGQRTSPSEISVLNTGSIDTLSQMIAKSLLDALNPSGQTKEKIVPTPVAMSRKRSLFDDLPLPSGRPSDANNTSPIQFGVHVNPPPPRDEDRNGPDTIAPVIPAVDLLTTELSNVSMSDPAVPNPITTVVAPDNSLPMSGLETPNFFPDPAVMAWAKLIVDSSEWSVEDRKSLMKEFIPEKELEHFFIPVHMPQQIKDAMQHRTIIESDYLLKRYTTETYLYNCNFDIVTTYRPLLQVISNLKGDPAHEKDRFLLGRVFQGLVSSTSKLSRGRRELARRFVPLSNAPAFYRTKPSHTSIFGGESTQSAVDQAVKDSKQDKSLVFIPKKKPFRSFGASGKGFQGHRFQNPQKYNPVNSYQSYQYPQYQSYQNNNSGKSYRGKGRGRGRGGRGKQYQSRAYSSKT